MAAREIKMGSLFDGSGGFPLAGLAHGITPAWASEVEPYPMRVTAARLPQMRQLGDVRKIDGGKVEPVDIVTFGSPCQDLSVAGKRAGIHGGERSSLFFEAIRIIKEMRAAHGDKPRFAIWENVPGARSSNGVEDFRAVLQAFAGTKGGRADVPQPKTGRWGPAGAILGDGWSLAWRTYDAQFWGIPQRRKRIYLVCDFDGERAAQILFKREGVPWDTEPGGEAREETAGHAARGAGGSGGARCYIIGADASGGMTSKNPEAGIYKTDLSRTLDLNGGNPACNQGGMIIVDPVKAYAADVRHGKLDDVSATLQAKDQGGYSLNYQNPVIYSRGYSGAMCEGAGTLRACSMRKSLDIIAVQKTCGAFHTLQDPINGEVAPREANRKYIVRRLTPTECGRLQGFPDWWTEGVQGSDSAQYKMWGNGIALPCAHDVVGRVALAIRKERGT